MWILFVHFWYTKRPINLGKQWEENLKSQMLHNCFNKVRNLLRKCIFREFNCIKWCWYAVLMWSFKWQICEFTCKDSILQNVRGCNMTLSVYICFLSYLEKCFISDGVNPKLNSLKGLLGENDRKEVTRCKRKHILEEKGSSHNNTDNNFSIWNVCTSPKNSQH